jgi:hypothetical protein
MHNVKLCFNYTYDYHHVVLYIRFEVKFRVLIVQNIKFGNLVRFEVFTAVTMKNAVF